MTVEITREEISAAAARIEPYVRVTPVIDLGDAFESGYRLFLKLDSLQPTGSFKVRGAFSALTTMIDESDRPVTAASGGNFGLAVAYAAGRLGIASHMFVPETSPAAKIDRIKAYGAEVSVVPGFYDQALEACRQYATSSGASMVHAYDQPEVVAGQGTLARELAGQAPDLGRILVAVGGGGLIGGIASWLREDALVVAVEPEECPSMHNAIASGAPTSSPVGGIAASALGAERVGDIAWAASRWIDGSVLVSEEAIVAAQLWLWDQARLAVEPAAATTIAALMNSKVSPGRGESVVAVISGANLDPTTLGRSLD